MTGQAPLGVDLQPPGSLSLPAPVWGIDPSTKRISVACVQGGLEWVETRSLPLVKDKHRRWRAWRDEIVDFLFGIRVRELAGQAPPSHVYVEEPFAPTDRRQQPTSYYLMGVLWAAIAQVFEDRPDVKFEEIGPGTWKRTAMGEGRGAAKPPEYCDWARDVAGYTGSIEDEAAAVGVATAGGVIVSGG